MPGYSKRWDRLARRAKNYYQAHPEVIVQCGLCHRPIDMWLHHNHPLAFTMDHIVPRILGGCDTLDNARPAHRSCNSRRARNLEKRMSNADGQRILMSVKSTRNW